MGAPNPAGGYVQVPTAMQVPVAAQLPSSPPGRSHGEATRAIVVAIVLLLIAAGLGFYAYRLWTDKHTAETQLTSAVAQVETLKARHTKVSERVIVLEKERVTTGNALRKSERQLSAMKAKLAVLQDSVATMKEERAEVRKQLAEFKAFSRQFQRMVDAGQLEVNFRRGRMVVELPAQVLFPSGSADLTPAGQDALRDVGKILRKIRDKRFIVAGHTDSLPVKNAQFSNNWELSSGRALTVTSALVAAGMKPFQLVAAGYAEHDPVASNRSKRGRKKNRRIEIILEPKLRDIDSP